MTKKCLNLCGKNHRDNSGFCSDDCKLDYFENYHIRKAQLHSHTHKSAVEWGKDYVNDKFSGARIEITYEQFKGDNIEIWKPGMESIPKEVIDSFIRDLSRMQFLYFDAYGIFLPWHIKVDDEGKCHLLLFNSNTGIHSDNKILRTGEPKIVNKEWK